MTKAVLVLSGGQDSTTCGFFCRKDYSELHAVTFNYGQRHARELKAAEQIADLIGCKTHEVIDVGPILAGTSPLVSKSELEQYKDFNSLPGGLEKTFVPARNLFFLTVAANRAYCLDTPNIITGVCQEDFGGYPDCRRDFIDALEQTLDEGMPLPKESHGGKVPMWNIVTPLMHLTKAKSVHLALQLEGCYQALAYSHTSYDGKYPPTGNDHATLLRAKGFFEAGVPDPLIVRAWWESNMNLPSTDNYSKYNLSALPSLTLTDCLDALTDMVRDSVRA